MAPLLVAASASITNRSFGQIGFFGIWFQLSLNHSKTIFFIQLHVQISLTQKKKVVNAAQTLHFFLKA